MRPLVGVRRQISSLAVLAIPLPGASRVGLLAVRLGALAAAAIVGRRVAAIAARSVEVVEGLRAVR
jgi:hypothetical protein